MIQKYTVYNNLKNIQKPGVLWEENTHNLYLSISKKKYILHNIINVECSMFTGVSRILFQPYQKSNNPFKVQQGGLVNEKNTKKPTFLGFPNKENKQTFAQYKHIFFFAVYILISTKTYM